MTCVWDEVANVAGFPVISDQLGADPETVSVIVDPLADHEPPTAASVRAPASPWSETTPPAPAGPGGPTPPETVTLIAGPGVMSTLKIDSGAVAIATAIAVLIIPLWVTTAIRLPG